MELAAWITGCCQTIHNSINFCPSHQNAQKLLDAYRYEDSQKGNPSHLASVVTIAVSPIWEISR